jgi:acetolactate synthase-1/2/3 large subunit
VVPLVAQHPVHRGVVADDDGVVEVRLRRGQAELDQSDLGVLDAGGASGAAGRALVEDEAVDELDPALKDAPILTGSGALLKSLEILGITDVFGLPGGAIMPFYDELMSATHIRHILVRHEQGAGHAAEGYAAASGRLGVAIATSGPGATNLVTAIADAHMDSVPLLAITGQVFSTSMGTDAFQEVDISGVTMPITKHSFLVTRPEDIPSVIKAAVHIATTGRPGPVLVDVTKDAQQKSAPFIWPEELDLPGYHPVMKANQKQVQAAAKMLVEAQRPLLYVGDDFAKTDLQSALP